MSGFAGKREAKEKGGNVSISWRSVGKVKGRRDTDPLSTTPPPPLTAFQFLNERARGRQKQN